MAKHDGFRLIAHSEFRNSTSKCYYKRDTGEYRCDIDGMSVGPLSKHQLESFNHVAKDVEDMRGSMIIYLEDNDT